MASQEKTGRGCMAIYHFHLQTISRGKQRSAMAAAAYRSASKIAMTQARRNNKAARLGLRTDPAVYDYRAKQGVLKTLILLPPGAPWESAPVVSVEREPTRMLSVEQFRIELVARAEMARTRVPPEYRPRLAVQDVIWDSDEHRQESGLGEHFREISQPADNGGFAPAPPPITQPFNIAAGLEPEQPYKQKVQIRYHA